MDIELVDSIHIQWKKIFHALKKFSQPVGDKLNITKVDSNILLALRHSKEKTKAELAASLSFKPNSLTRSIDRLISMGVINKLIDNEDRRFVKLSLTAQGETLAEQYLIEMRQLWKKALQNIPNEELKQLDLLIKKISNNLYK